MGQQQPVPNTTQIQQQDQKTVIETPAAPEKVIVKKKSVLEAFTGQVKTVILSNELTIVEIDPISGSIKSVSMTQQKQELGGTELVKLCAGAKIGALSIDKQEWKLGAKPIVKSSINSLDLTRKLFKGKQSFVVTQSWMLKDKYQLDYNISIKNTSDHELHIPEFTINSGEMQSLAQLTGVQVNIPEINIDYVNSETNDFVKSAVGDEREDFPTRSTQSASIISVNNKFFAIMLKPSTPFTQGIIPVGSFAPDNTTEGFDVSGNYGDVTVTPGETTTFAALYFAGIKDQNLIIDFDKSAEDVMHLSSFGPLAYLSERLIDALEFFKGLTGSYGIAIVLLTILVRTIFWPITAKGTASMKKMQELQPLMKEIKEKYKDDQQTASMKTMALYKEHKVNPVGGCLPMLVQIPIFMAFYWGLDGAIALRHVSFLWANDLAQPDVIGLIPFIDLPLHPLVLIMAALMVVQQKLTPSTGDQMQKNMMMIMPLVMVVFMYSMPAGLTLYWSVSNTMSIIQLLATQKFSNKPKAIEA